MCHVGCGLSPSMAVAYSFRRVGPLINDKGPLASLTAPGNSSTADGTSCSGLSLFYSSIILCAAVFLGALFFAVDDFLGGSKLNVLLDSLNILGTPIRAKAPYEAASVLGPSTYILY